MDKKNQFVILGVAILGAISIFIGASFAFGAFFLNSTRKHIIKAADMDVVLEESSDGINLVEAVPVYDEVGMIGESYDFRLVNKGGIPATYHLKLNDITDTENKLNLSDIRIGVTKNGVTKIESVSNLPLNNMIDVGTISQGETIEYHLRLWIRNGVSDISTIEGKSFKLKAEVELTDAKFLGYLSTAKQGSYVSYVGNNGCRLNGTSTTGTGNAESGNSCKGDNANGGWCFSSSNKFKTSGWRIAYTENNRAYLITGGSPECNIIVASTGNTNYINFANNQSRKYCNQNYVDGDCSNNNDSWAIGNADFNKITKQATGTGGGYLNVAISGAIGCYNVKNNRQCGHQTDLINAGGYYWFATSASNTQRVRWEPSTPYVQTGAYDGANGLRPIIRLSQGIYITGGAGTLSSPYTIAKSLF